MADTLKVLGQSALSTQTLTDVYTVTPGSQATVSTLTVCNRSAVPTTFRISIAVAGAADSSKQYLYYNEPLPAYSSFIATIGLSLGSTDVIRAYTLGSDVSVNVFGVEVS